MPNDVIQQIAAHRIIPVVAIENASEAVALGDALASGGLPVAEITFRTESAEASIRALSRRDDFLLGAGTVLSVENVKRAVDAGAKFIVAPGFNPRVVEYCVKYAIPVTPGIATPTEIEMALDLGVHVVKFFPAELLGGMKMLNALAAPYGMIRFIPTGGIDQKNVLEYLKSPKVVACGGSWIVTKQLLAAKNFVQITALAREAVGLVKAAAT